MKKFVGIIILVIIVVFGLIKVKEYYYNDVNQEIEEKNSIEEKQIDKVAINNIINSININIASQIANNPNYQVPEVLDDLSFVTVKGTKPESINLEIRNIQVYSGDILYKGIMYHYDNGIITIKE